MLRQWQASFGYAVARRMFHWPWALRSSRVWVWMQGQYARKAAMGDVQAQSFYGHLLLFRGQGFGVREHALGLLRQAALAGDSKSAYQLGVEALRGDLENPPSAKQTVHWWKLAAQGKHPLALLRLVELIRSGDSDFPVEPELAERYQRQLDELSD